MGTILELEKVSFSYADVDVVKDVSMVVNKKDFVGIIGPNGSGKTTLLKILLGIFAPRKGSVKIFGCDMRHFREWNRVGYVPQKAVNIEKNFPATVYEIVSMGLLSRFSRIKKMNHGKEIKKALSVVRMEKFANKRISELSGGQQQRVLIAKALVTSPEILILDEPTTGVDQDNQHAFYELLGRLNQNGITILLVSHDIGRINKHVNKIASINQTLDFFGSHKDFCAKDPEHEHILCLHKRQES